MTLKTFTPLRDRLGNRRERGGGLFNHLTVVADDAPPPVRVTGSRDRKHVHLDDLDALLLARRSALVMIVVPTVGANSTVFRFEATNRGNKSARDFYWHIWVPSRLVGGATFTGPPLQDRTVRDVVILDGNPYNELSDCLRDPIYPTRSVWVINVEITRANLAGAPSIRWRLVDEDGVFPVQAEGGEGRGIIEIGLPA